MVDALVIAPCTGNTMAKLACGITDTPVTMAAKSCLRIGLPVVLCPATNDALAASAQNIGRLLKHQKCLFCAHAAGRSGQKKPSSLVADFSQLLPAVESALKGRQIQPVFCKS